MGTKYLQIHSVALYNTENVIHETVGVSINKQISERDQKPKKYHRTYPELWCRLMSQYQNTNQNVQVSSIKNSG